MPANTAPERPVITVGETRNVAVSFVGVLDDGELLTGTPIVTEVASSDLTITHQAVNNTARTISGQRVPAGKAVQFRVSGQQASRSSYTIEIKVNTNASPPQTLVKYVKFIVAAE